MITLGLGSRRSSDAPKVDSLTNSVWLPTTIIVSRIMIRLLRRGAGDHHKYRKEDSEHCRAYPQESSLEIAEKAMQIKQYASEYCCHHRYDGDGSDSSGFQHGLPSRECKKLSAGSRYLNRALNFFRFVCGGTAVRN